MKITEQTVLKECAKLLAIDRRLTGTGRRRKVMDTRVGLASPGIAFGSSKARMPRVSCEHPGVLRNLPFKLSRTNPYGSFNLSRGNLCGVYISELLVWLREESNSRKPDAYSTHGKCDKDKLQPLISACLCAPSGGQTQVAGLG